MRARVKVNPVLTLEFSALQPSPACYLLELTQANQLAERPFHARIRRNGVVVADSYGLTRGAAVQNARYAVLKQRRAGGF